MSAAPGRMMMAWVWISLVSLARLNTAEEPHRDAAGSLAGLEALFPDSELPVGTRSGGRSFPVPVWKFVKEHGGGPASDFSRPQYRCSGVSLSVRFTLVQHTDLRLEDGRRVLSLLDRCRGSVRTFGPWLLLKLPYTSCHMGLWVSNGTWSRQLNFRYLDQLLRANVSAVAACENPATSLQLVPPLVTCRTTHVTVKLPPGSRLQRVKALGKGGVAGKAVTTVTTEALYVQIPKVANTDSIFEVNYFDSAGDASTTLAACLNKTTRGPDRWRRALEEPDLWELWGFEDIPLEPFVPEPEPPTTTPPTTTPVTEPPTTTPPTTTPVTTPPTTTPEADGEIFELWGFDEIPEEPYTGDTAAPPTTTSASTTTTSATTTTSDSPFTPFGFTTTSDP